MADKHSNEYQWTTKGDDGKDLNIIEACREAASKFMEAGDVVATAYQTATAGLDLIAEAQNSPKPYTGDDEANDDGQMDEWAKMAEHSLETVSKSLIRLMGTSLQLSIAGKQFRRVIDEIELQKVIDEIEDAQTTAQTKGEI